MVSMLAEEHILCSPCRDSANNSRLLPALTHGRELFRSYASLDELQASSLAGCHLCSLFLGTFGHGISRKRREISVEIRLSILRPGDVSLQVVAVPYRAQIPSKTALDVGSRHEDGEQVVGELPVSRGSEWRLQQPQPESPFSFSSPSIYENAQLSKSLSYEASAALAREWLAQCMQRHKKCCLASELFSPSRRYPTRLVDVGGGRDNEPLRLVFTSELDRDGSDWKPNYLTLSHCWGGANIVKLLLRNVNVFKSSIPFANLPTTFRDAIMITRQLGFRYIWIDSLCIIQDSPLDWRSESEIMGEIYGHSTCTIAALTAHSSSDGCFHGHRYYDGLGAHNKRNPLTFRTCKLPNGLHVKFPTRLEPEFKIDRTMLPLHTRAWVVQERLLAPRTLYYGSWGLAWECVECSATEGLPFGKKDEHSPKASFFAACLRATHASIKGKVATVYDMWHNIRDSYTPCHLTYFDDRIIAISSVVKRIEQLTCCTNIWGLWKDNLLHELLWTVRPSERPKIRGYLAPSWSWASVQGQVYRYTVGTEATIWSAQVMEAGMDHGRGFIRLRAATKEVVPTIGVVNAFVGYQSDLLDKTRPGYKVVSWGSDTLSHTVTGEIQCVLLMRISIYKWAHNPKHDLDLGLVVSRKEGEAVRIGIFSQSRSDIRPLFEENIKDADMKELVIF